MRKKLWYAIESIGVILGIVGYFRQYPLKIDINMNSNYLLMFFGSICLVGLVITGVSSLLGYVRQIHSMLYNHAHHIMMIEKCYKKEENASIEGSFIDPNEIIGVIHPNKEQTSNSSKIREKMLEQSKKNFPHLFK